MSGYPSLGLVRTCDVYELEPWVTRWASENWRRVLRMWRLGQPLHASDRVVTLRPLAAVSFLPDSFPLLPVVLPLPGRAAA